MSDAATALEAKDKEIEALREQHNQAMINWQNELIRATAATARAETAERKLAEARAALKPFTRIPLAHTDDIDDSATVFEYEGGAITLGDLRRAARAVIEKE